MCRKSLLSVVVLILSAGVGTGCATTNGPNQVAAAENDGVGSAGETTDSKDSVFPEGVCRVDGVGGTVRINPECIRQDMAVKPGLKLVDLGTVLVATFDSVGSLKVSGKEQIVKVSKADSDITNTVSRRLLDAGLDLVVRERSETDKMLQELNQSTSSLIDATTAPLIGHQLGARTLIIGRYDFSGEASYSLDDKGDMVIHKPDSVNYQTIWIKALDIEKGMVLVDTKVSMTGKVADVLMPHLLARYAVQRILGALEKADMVF